LAGDSALPPTLTNKKGFKKMEKKLYLEPEVEVINLMLGSTLLAGSIEEETEAIIDPTEGGQDSFPQQ
jgi:hypothetical protein